MVLISYRIFYIALMQSRLDDEAENPGFRIIFFVMNFLAYGKLSGLIAMRNVNGKYER